MGNPVNGASVFKSISEIAEIEAVSKPAISKRVKKLADAGLEVERNDKGHVIGVAYAQYEDMRGALDNTARVVAGRVKSKGSVAISVSGGVVLDPNSREAVELDRSMLARDREKRKALQEAGELVYAADVRKHEANAGREVQAAVKRLANHADDLMIEAGKGVHAMRLKLDAIATEMLSDIAKTFQTRADTAPEHDPSKSDDDA